MAILDSDLKPLFGSGSFTPLQKTALKKVLENVLAGVTSAELEFLDGATAGTGVASKALVLDASGNVVMPTAGVLQLSIAALAAAGTTAANAGAIAAQITAVTASDGVKGVVLPAAATAATAGPRLIINTVATAGLLVYPVNGGNDNINALAEDLPFTLAPGAAAWFVPTSATQWYVADATASITQGGLKTTGNIHSRGKLLTAQGAPTAKTVTAAISAAELVTGIITTTGVTAPSVHQLPTGTLLAAEFPGIAVGDSFDFSVINTGTGASDDATLTVNTDVTIVGSPTVGALTDATIISGSGRFKARYTATNTWVVYRLA